MPNQPRKDNPGRLVRVEDSLWEEAKRLTALEGTTVSAVIRAGLKRYVAAARRRLANRED